jgi:DNA polymerase-3 subunit delta
MPEIKYQSLNNYLENLQQDGFAPVYLIYGEELLYKSAAEALLDALIPAAQRSLNYEPIEGTSDNIQEAIERINTYSLLPGTKVVALYDANIFYSKQDEGKLLAKAKEAHAGNDNKNASRYLLNFMGTLKLSFDDLRRDNRSKTLKPDADSLNDDQWLDDTIRYCQEQGLPIPAIEDSAEAVQRAIAKGFPQGNHLIITADLVDKRRSLYKTIRQKGIIVNCSIPKGDRRADKIAQDAALNERRQAILNQFNKTMDQGTYQAVCEMTGFDLRTFSQNLEKLVNFVGDRKQITVDDVEHVLERTKKDPIYELTNAIADRDIVKSLFFSDSLLAADFHPLQILAAITNQVRKLLLIKGFVESPQGGNWQAGINFANFKSHIMPAIEAYDRTLVDQIESWEHTSEDASDQGGVPKKAKKKSLPMKDLMVAKNPKNPYPVYQLLLKSERYTTAELVAALERLSGADMRLKSTAQRPKLILEEAVLKICGTPST